MLSANGASVPPVSITAVSATINGVFAGVYPLIDFNPPSSAGVQSKYCTLNQPGDPVFSANSYSRPMVEVVPQPNLPCAALSVPGTGSSFTADFVAGLLVVAAGTQTFTFYHDDDFSLYIGPNSASQQPTPSGSGSGGPLTGYPYIGGAGGWGYATLSVTFPAAGFYPMEAVLNENGSGEQGLTMGTSAQDPLPAATLSTVTALEALGAGSPSLLYQPPTCGCYPVNPQTGDFWHTFQDLGIPGRGLPLRFSHTYNSLAATQSGPLGYGWTDNVNLSLSTDTTGVISVTEEGGSVVTFNPVSGHYQPPSHVLASLVSSTDGSVYTFTRRDQEQFVFTAPTPMTPGGTAAGGRSQWLRHDVQLYERPTDHDHRPGWAGAHAQL